MTTATPPKERIRKRTGAGTGDAWRVIVMNANGTRDVTSELSIGASFPHLQTIGIAALGSGLLLLLLSGSALYVVVRRRR